MTIVHAVAYADPATVLTLETVRRFNDANGEHLELQTKANDITGTTPASTMTTSRPKPQRIFG